MRDGVDRTVVIAVIVGIVALCLIVSNLGAVVDQLPVHPLPVAGVADVRADDRRRSSSSTGVPCWWWGRAQAARTLPTAANAGLTPPGGSR